jgi:ribosomal protein S6--L-glutamate ligase
MTMGIARNPYSAQVATWLAGAATDLGIPHRVIDFPTLTVNTSIDGHVVVRDSTGVVEITSLVPYLLSGYPVAVHAVRVLSRRAYAQNPVDSVLIADDKAATAVRLSLLSLPHVPSVICPLDLPHVLSAADEIGYPVVLKRAHGAHGRGVRRAQSPACLETAFQELAPKSSGMVIVQPQITESYGRSIRVVITGGDVLAAALRTAIGNEWRSNLAYGGTQHRIELTPAEKTLAKDTAYAIGLGHAGVDILRTSQGPRVLEVNSYPGLTTMLSPAGDDLARAVLLASLPP